MGLFGRSKAEREQLNGLQLELNALRERLNQSDSARTELEARLATVDTDHHEMNAQLTALSRDNEELAGRVGEIAESAALTDSRITSVATELTNQLAELSGELDSLTAPADTGRDAPDLPPPDPEEFEARIDRTVVERVQLALDEIQDGQERLASEQARYQIQFRKDLAEVAERLRRPGTA